MWLLTELKKRKKEDKPAVICRERCLTYRQLWEQSEQIAQKMLGDLQTKAPILIYGNKNNEIIPVMVAALKTGRAYVPVDVTFPVERLSRIQKITEAEMVFNFSHADLGELSKDCLVIQENDYAEIIADTVSGEVPEDQWVQGKITVTFSSPPAARGIPRGFKSPKITF